MAVLEKFAHLRPIDGDLSTSVKQPEIILRVSVARVCRHLVVMESHAHVPLRVVEVVRRRQVELRLDVASVRARLLFVARRPRTK